MSLSKGEYVSNEDFNNLKTRILSECTRRSTSTSSYYKNTFDSTNTPVIADKSDFEYIFYTYMNSILDFFNKFNVFPGTNLLNQIYTNGTVDQYDIIYALNNLLTILQSIENENFRNNDDCNNACMGLCTSTCADKCTNNCTSCTGGCSGSCYTSCSGDCDGGCSGCSNSCLEGCGDQCGGSGGCTSCDIICMSPNYNHL